VEKTKKIIVQTIEDFVKERLKQEGSGHDWWHIDRVRKNALLIGKHEEEVNMFIVETAALLHDLIDDKLSNEIKLEVTDVKKLLIELEVDSNEVDEILFIIENISFRKHISAGQLSLEGKIVQDADRLDAIGAIGIARTFAFAGSRGNVIYDPEGLDLSYAIQHFYDKLLKLKELMNTKTGKLLAEERHQYLEGFLEQFLTEWNGLEKI